MYLIVVGILAGILLGPAVMGRLAPQTHRDWFGGIDPQVVNDELDAFRDETTRQLEAYAATGVTKVAVDEFLDRRATQRQELQQRLQHDITCAGIIQVLPLTVAVVLALVVVMVLESMVAPDPNPDQGPTAVPPALGRLVTVRYALIAVWLALTLAQPTMLWSLPLVFTGVLIAVALLAGLVPLGKRRSG